MSIATKTRAILTLSGSKPSELSDCLGISVQAIRNKFSRDSISFSDFIKICDYLGCEHIVKTKGGQIINITLDDIKQSSENTKADDTDKPNIDTLTEMDKLVIDAVLNPAVPPEGTKVITEEDVKNGYRL